MIKNVEKLKRENGQKNVEKSIKNCTGVFRGAPPKENDRTTRARRGGRGTGSNEDPRQHPTRTTKIAGAASNLFASSPFYFEHASSMFEHFDH